jgi:hypothetical protein
MGGVWKSAGRIRTLRIVGGLIVAYGALGVVWPFAPMHLREELAAGRSTPSDTIHIVFGERNSPPHAAGHRIWDSGIRQTFPAGPRVAINLPTPLLGVWERINLGVFLLWVVVLATVRLRVPEADMKKVTSCSFSMVKGGNNESLYSRATRAS